jgi:hypothetical protein
MELFCARQVLSDELISRALMENLVFACPKTGRQVDIGVATEIGTLLRIRSRVVLARCPACGETHEWPVRDAWLVQAA